MPIETSRYAISTAGKGGWNYVVDNIRGVVSAVVGWIGIELHNGWFHSLVAGTRPGCTVN